MVLVYSITEQVELQLRMQLNVWSSVSINAILHVQSRVSGCIGGNQSISNALVVIYTSLFDSVDQWQTTLKQSYQKTLL